jgi:hypothetical protein
MDRHRSKGDIATGDIGESVLMAGKKSAFMQLL